MPTRPAPAALPPAPAPVFQPFSWNPQDIGTQGVMPSHRVVSTASTIRDVAGGAAVVLELIERNMLDAEASDDAAPLLSPIHQGALMRLVVSAFRLVEREAIELQELAHSTPTAGQRSPSAATAEGGAA